MEPWPLSSDGVHFVNSVDSSEFSLFLRALDQAYIVAMDAEWKPLRSKNTKTFPRVSIMQLACRLATCSGDPLLAHSEDTIVGGSNNVSEDPTVSTSHASRSAVVIHQSAPSYSEGLQNDLELSLSKLKIQKEVIFLLDMMSLPVNSFWEPMKKMLVSPTVLKLGFKFKQDLVNLSKSFPGPDAHSCFDKVDPYLDIGKLFLEVCGWDRKQSNSMSLAAICEEVVGYTLCKDLQCSNWEQRPLSEEQQVYAAADAHCLLVIYDILESKGLEGHSLSADSVNASTGDGIGGILYESSSPWLANSSGNIVHTRHGVATVMVKSAVAKGMLATVDTPRDAFSAAHTVLVRKFCERILLSEEMKKSIKKKPKRILGNRDTRLSEHGFFGPPPWDPSCGGDGTPKFLCDNMVEGLAKQLRNVGFDTVFLKKSDPRKLVELAEKEGRVLLTQDANLLRRGFIPRSYAYRVKSNGKQEQLAEVVRIFNLEILEDNLLSRCNKCNGEFFPDALTPEEALAALSEGQTFPQYALEERVLFWQCSQCLHMYWQGKQFYRALQNFQAFARKVQTSE
ncbi:hypothetical protein GOP47_0001530 [Adiantum capillus-veneris]|uniref:3'-5' exonuclease domain-containing protein n=1 Tax=Adiantum capillus-veneris TaxID=13818 RepID=A0A9D4ZQ71_ADICA|nr:hypothetical protein GOP47_0001530 [Adiantum capillus-veneris]